MVDDAPVIPRRPSHRLRSTIVALLCIGAVVLCYARVERDLRVGDRWKFFVLHFDQFAGVLGFGA